MLKILFLYYMEPKLEESWNDGLCAALDILGSNGDFEIKLVNIYSAIISNPQDGDYDFILGWGGFDSPVDKLLYAWKHNPLLANSIPMGLCIGGNAFPVRKDDTYDVLFYETTWFAPQVEWHPLAIRAFGINSEIFFELQPAEHIPYPLREDFALYDYVSAGSFSNWKRHIKIIEKEGSRLCIGQIQQDNLSESMTIVYDLIRKGVAVSDQVDAWQLALIFNLTHNVYVPASIIGGGERVVWEARACGAYVEVEEDNPKLQSLLDEEVQDEYWYYRQLKKGIQKCLKK